MSALTVSDDSDSRLVAPLGSFRRGSLALAGGKGANLGELIGAGFDVPPGFVITTRAYDLLIEADDLRPQIQGMLASLRANDAASVADVSQRIQAAIEHASVPDSIADAVRSAFWRLEAEAVAVRSSATAEDLSGAAFAGQQETYLNVIGEGALMDAVRACWASLWSERAVFYRAHQGVDQASVKLAIVVQQMVPADTAGVIFTANPISGARDELLIDATPGLGEAVVGGLTTPDHLVIAKRGLRVREQRLGRREVIIRAKAGGGTELIAPASGPAGMALSPSAARRLARLGIAIERHYGAPQDIEWAWVEDGRRAGKFLVLQARPMTALPEPLKESGPMRMVVAMLAEMWPTRPYPLDVTTFTGTLERAIGNLLAVMLGKSAPDPEKALLEEDGVVVRFEPPTVRPSPGMLVTPWLTLWRTRRYDPANWQADPIIAEVVAEARELEMLDVDSLPWGRNIETLHRALALIPGAMQLRERYLPHALLGLGVLWLTLGFTGHRDRTGRLISGVESKTTETNRALETLAAEIRGHAALREMFAHEDAPHLLPALRQSQAGRDFLQELTAFLAHYGHRETTLTISQPAWVDRPEAVIGILKVLVGSGPMNEGSHKAWSRTRDELLSDSVLGRWPLRRLFLKSLTNARCLSQIREDTHFYATMAQPLIRRIALELGNRLEQAGALDSPADIFHLKLDELEGLEDPWPPSAETITRIRDLVARRKTKRESLEGKPMVDPRLLKTNASAMANDDVLLSGSAGSPGIASGPARIVRDESEFGRLHAGEVLVSPVTNPAWTPLFQGAVAVVVDTGGPASHAAIVAREYGIPAVMGTVNGTRQLTDGQWIKVDGSRGLVLKTDPRPERS